MIIIQTYAHRSHTIPCPVFTKPCLISFFYSISLLTLIFSNSLKFVDRSHSNAVQVSTIILSFYKNVLKCRHQISQVTFFGKYLYFTQFELLIFVRPLISDVDIFTQKSLIILAVTLKHHKRVQGKVIEGRAGFVHGLVTLKELYHKYTEVLLRVCGKIQSNFIHFALLDLNLPPPHIAI